ncbi:MAG: 16S rRNA (adenine(1518)-N(6)/adenine(1519)-N(6))-dimethyltransferase RsmA [Clostridiales bacterium]|jgi:16S rRNA (adenine1518-N6/adenine1519-N6)-dimethyltransferase|nr:16S rRNA (adenine(1518)-N(6)/adenine(1519)-N(6))-dimethyltransferase RsmA [Clostridiales bacterium]
MTGNTKGIYLPSGVGVGELMLRHGISPKKYYGQNFLTDKRVISAIVLASGITPNDNVIEIGPGLGALTLALPAKQILAVEIDAELVAALRDVCRDRPHVEILQADIMKTNIQLLMAYRGWQTAKICANLPYYISTHIIVELLENAPTVASITVMLQREVAERLVATPQKGDYGAISLLVKFYGEARIDMFVPRGCFVPAPKVDSAVVTIKRQDNPNRDCPIVTDKELLFEVIKAAFGHRRKILLNCLRSASIIQNREKCLEIFDRLGFDENARGENLSLDQFVALTEAILHERRSVELL